jgi:peptide chain release factor 2
MASPDFWNDQNAARKTVKELKALKALIDPYDKLRVVIGDLDAALEMGAEDAEFAAEAEELLGEARKQLDAFELATLFDEEWDHFDCFLRIQAGAGGTDAQDWAQMLQRMYLRYGERTGLKMELIAEDEGEEAGIKSCEIRVAGPLAYGLLRNEMGVHRMVRKSPFNSAGSRETSFASIEVVPEFEDLDSVDIDWDKDVREDVYRAGGKGGQHVNRTESAVRLTHLATGITAQCQNERSQHQNRDIAKRTLAARILQYERAKRDKELAAIYGDRGEVAWGNQIRSYVLDDRRVKDHRTNHDTGNPERVLDGDIDDFIEAQVRKRKTR